MDLDQDTPGLVGRPGVRAELAALLDGPGAALLVGDAGIGKTTLARAFATRAGTLGHPVVRTGGDATGGPYSALRPLFERAEVAQLPPEQGRAVRSALDGAGHEVDLLALRGAMCVIAGQLAGERPLVLVVDDVDRVDAPSFDLLLTLASVLSWAQLSAVALFVCRTERVPGELAELVRPIVVPPLAGQEAEQLFDTLPGAPDGSARHEIIRRAAGNPLALREYAEWADGAGGSDETRVFARRVAALPELSLRALTLAAAGERSLAVIARADPAVTLAAWRPAEDTGLITVADDLVRFRHPLVEYAVLEAAGPGARRHAHRLLAATATDPLRGLWHRTAAADRPDPELAAELAGSARLLDGAGTVTAVGLLEQAHDHAVGGQRAMMLFEAGMRAAAAGRVRWAGSLLTRARAALGDGDITGVEADVVGLGSWLHTVRGELDTASALLAGTIRRTGAAVPPGLLVTAALPAFLLGDGELRTALRTAVPRITTTPGPPFLFARALAAPGEQVRAEVLAQRETTDLRDMSRAATVGAAALLLDEPEHAVRLLGPAVTALVEGAAANTYLAAPGAAGWALVDTGRWTEAERWLVPLQSSPVMSETPLLRTGVHVVLAVVAYLRGRPDRAGELLAAGPLDPYGVPVFALRLNWARGLAAAAGGDHGEAWRLLSAAAAVEHDWRALVLPDLAAAARRTGRDRPAPGAGTSRAGTSWLSTRRRGRADLTGALGEDDPGVAAARMAAVLDDPRARRWPFERAVLAVERADLLRRAQQPRAAQDVLVDALDAFDHVGAAGWAARVRAELRTPVVSRPDPFAGLSAQQEQIVRLAAQGLSNREIGARLYLSPRTVGSHLYRVFPQLGVANRTQLADLLSTADQR
ncbi:AAA family ATPase [Actinoplanes sp. NPDC051494]|uniref:AAA family ATPase n=1 Tax=Actinoplanes sp. NPDC051494 TaxID=3363907 RepID=UPI0037928CE4